MCANKNTIVRTAVVIYVSFYNVWHQFIATLQVHAIIGACSENISGHLWKARNKVGLLTGTNNGLSIRLNMNFCSDVSEAEQASGDYGDWVALVVHPREIRHLRVEERSPGFISNARRPKRDSSDSRALGQVKRHEQRVKLCDPSTK